MREEEKKGEEAFFIVGRDSFLVRSRYWSLEREEEEERTSKKRIFIWELSSEGRGKIASSQAIATKAVQVCTSLLLEFLLIFDFSVCSIPEYLIVLLIFVWTKRATICFVDIGYLCECHESVPDHPPTYLSPLNEFRNRAFMGSSILPFLCCFHSLYFVFSVVSLCPQPTD